MALVTCQYCFGGKNREMGGEWRQAITLVGSRQDCATQDAITGLFRPFAPSGLVVYCVMHIRGLEATGVREGARMEADLNCPECKGADLHSVDCETGRNAGLPSANADLAWSPEENMRVAARIAQLKHDRGRARHRLGSLEDARQQGEMVAFDMVLKLLSEEGT